VTDHGPYRAAPQRPMSDLTRDRLLISIARLLTRLPGYINPDEEEALRDALKIAEHEMGAAPRPKRHCSEGGYCVFSADAEYDATGNTVNCEKCGEP